MIDIHRVGVATGGGDTTVLNAQIEKIIEVCDILGIEVYGFIGGWEGVLKKQGRILRLGEIDPWFGGSDIENTRTKLEKAKGDYETARTNLRELGIDALIPIGGDDTLSVARNLDFLVMGIIKTVDNDVGTMPPANSYDFEKMLSYFTLGFMKAAFAANDFIAGEYGLITTARSHRRIMLIETMGAKSGWMALSTYPSGPDLVVIGEYPLNRNLDDLATRIIGIYDAKKEKPYVIVVVAENARYEDGTLISKDETRTDKFGKAQLGGVAQKLETALSNHPKIRERFPNDPRKITAVTPGHLYRSGTPHPIEKEIAEQLATAAVLYLIQKKRGVVGVGYNGRGFYPQRIDPQEMPVKQDPKTGELIIQERLVDDRFYDPQKMAITEEGRRYYAPILRGIEGRLHHPKNGR